MIPPPCRYNTNLRCIALTLSKAVTQPPISNRTITIALDYIWFGLVNKTKMTETKPFSRSLKRLIAHDYLQQQDISHFLTKPNPNPELRPLPTTRLQTQPATHTHSPLARAAKVRSRFEAKIDEIVGQVMKEQELPVIDSRKGPLITRRQKQNLRISTETSQPTNSTPIPDSVNFVSSVLEFILNREIAEQQKKKRRLQREDLCKCRVNSRWDPRQTARNTKELLSYYPLSKYREEQEELSLEKVRDCREYLRQFRKGKSSLRELPPRR